ncbi:R3H domain-containing protein 2-like [Arapaima gigas]
MQNARERDPPARPCPFFKQESLGRETRAVTPFRRLVPVGYEWLADGRHGFKSDPILVTEDMGVFLRVSRLRTSDDPGDSIRRERRSSLFARRTPPQGRVCQVPGFW